MPRHRLRSKSTLESAGRRRQGSFCVQIYTFMLRVEKARSAGATECVEVLLGQSVRVRSRSVQTPLSKMKQKMKKAEEGKTVNFFS
jgi:hypothetical protein